MNKMTFNEMYSRILEILPDASCGEDNEGQIVIYTNKKEVKDEDGNDVLVDFEPE